MKGSEVKKILKQHEVKMADIAKMLNISSQHFNNWFNTEDMQTSKIEQLSELTGLNIWSMLYPESMVHGKGEQLTEIAHLKELLQEKDKRLRTQELLIEKLMDK